MELKQRKEIRLKAYDYSTPGYYFVTICTYERKCILSAVVPAAGGPPMLSDLGRTVETGLANIPRVYPHIKVDKYCIMPNHLHVILAFGEKNGGRPMAAPTQENQPPVGAAIGRPSLLQVVNQFKGYVTKRAGVQVWQKSYYEHVLRTEKEYLDVWRYIDENPLKWSDDEYFA